MCNSNSDFAVDQPLLTRCLFFTWGRGLCLHLKKALPGISHGKGTSFVQLNAVLQLDCHLEIVTFCRNGGAYAALCLPLLSGAFDSQLMVKKTIGGGKFCGWSRMIPPSIREVFFYIFGWNFDRKCHCFFLGEAFCFIISSIGSTLLTLVLYCIALNAVLTDAERAHRHLRVLPYVGYQMKFFLFIVVQLRQTLTLSNCTLCL